MAASVVLLLGGEGLAPLCRRLGEAGYDPRLFAPGDAEACLRAVDGIRPAAVLLPAAPGAASLTRLLTERGGPPVLWVIDRGAAPHLREARGAGVAGVIRAEAEIFEVQVALELALQSYDDRQRLSRTVARLEEALAARKLVERAKGLLMEQYGLPEGAAYERLRKLAMGSRKPMREVAEMVIALAEAGRPAGAAAGLAAGRGRREGGGR